MLRHAYDLFRFEKDRLIELISEFIEVTRLVKAQRNEYSALVMSKIKQKTSLSSDPLADEISEAEEEPKNVKESIRQEVPKQLYMLTPVAPYQQYYLPQEPMLHQMPFYYPQPPLYYVMPPQPNLTSVFGVPSRYPL